jgi:hypothetical protein
MDMRIRHSLYSVLWIILLSTALVSCTSAQSEALLLESFTENYVDVSIYLEQDSEGKYVLSATFTPPAGYHLYSKDIPITGIGGVGRPTLLELTSNSTVKANGTLIESVKAQVSDFEPKELLVYPAGAVTLSLPIELPPGNGWSEEKLQVTYMACSASLCKPPVVGRIISVQIPGVDRVEHE